MNEHMHQRYGGDPGSPKSDSLNAPAPRLGRAATTRREEVQLLAACEHPRLRGDVAGATELGVASGRRSMICLELELMLPDGDGDVHEWMNHRSLYFTLWRCVHEVSPYTVGTISCRLLINRPPQLN